VAASRFEQARQAHQDVEAHRIPATLLLIP
jgi:hypothetical protein